MLTNNPLVIPVDPSKDHTQGPQNASVTLVEYGDYECPYCGIAFGILESIEEQLDQQLFFVFRNFPLTQAHPHASLAAAAAEAAAEQNHFWQMHDLLYKNQESLEYEDLMNYAQSLNLDLNKFQTDLDSEEVHAKIRADFIGGVRSGVNGTPSFYINGLKFEGDWSEGELLEDLQTQKRKIGQH